MDAATIAYYEANTINVETAARVMDSAKRLAGMTNRAGFVAQYGADNPVAEFAGIAWDMLNAEQKVAA